MEAIPESPRKNRFNMLRSKQRNKTNPNEVNTKIILPNSNLDDINSIDTQLATRPLFSGHLFHLSPDLNWKRRLVTFDGMTIRYYKAPHTTSTTSTGILKNISTVLGMSSNPSQSTDPKITIRLDEIGDIKLMKVNSQHLESNSFSVSDCFIIALKNHHQHVLRASDTMDLNRWLFVLLSELPRRQENIIITPPDRDYDGVLKAWNRAKIDTMGTGPSTGATTPITESIKNLDLSSRVIPDPTAPDDRSYRSGNCQHALPHPESSLTKPWTETDSIDETPEMMEPHQPNLASKLHYAGSSSGSSSTTSSSLDIIKETTTNIDSLTDQDLKRNHSIQNHSNQMNHHHRQPELDTSRPLITKRSEPILKSPAINTLRRGNPEKISDRMLRINQQKPTIQIPLRSSPSLPLSNIPTRFKTPSSERIVHPTTSSTLASPSHSTHQLTLTQTHPEYQRKLSQPTLDYQHPRLALPPGHRSNLSVNDLKSHPTTTHNPIQSRELPRKLSSSNVTTTTRHQRHPTLSSTPHLTHHHHSPSLPHLTSPSSSRQTLVLPSAPHLSPRHPPTLPHHDSHHLRSSSYGSPLASSPSTTARSSYYPQPSPLLNSPKLHQHQQHRRNPSALSPARKPLPNSSLPIQSQPPSTSRVIPRHRQGPTTTTPTRTVPSYHP